MEINDVKRLALILAVQAEIEGMKAENTQRELRKSSIIAYDEDAFQAKAEELRNLVHANDIQLFG